VAGCIKPGWHGGSECAPERRRRQSVMVGCDGWLKLKGKAHQSDSLEKRLNELE
jgi:hypothetical protein